MTRDTSKASDEAQIRERIDTWAKALRAKNIDGVMSHYRPDILTFDLAPPLQHAGQVYRQGLVEWFATFKGPIGIEMRDLSITVGGDVAFTHSLNRISGARTSGEHTDVWVRSTVCFTKTTGKWMVAHEHVSVPFYMDGSERAAVDLKP